MEGWIHRGKRTVLRNLGTVNKMWKTAAILQEEKEKRQIFWKLTQAGSRVRLMSFCRHW